VYTLSAWYADVLKRYDQLAAWTAGDIVTPVSVWLPGLFNPKAFLTAVMQTYARSNKLPLDVMRFMTEGESFDGLLGGEGVGGRGMMPVRHAAVLVR
jgi:hypothetical protein